MTNEQFHEVLHDVEMSFMKELKTDDDDLELRDMTCEEFPEFEKRLRDIKELFDKLHEDVHAATGY
jgi:hypothetical protein